MNDIFSSTLPIFLITLLGSIIKKKWFVSEEFWRGLEKLSYFILFPALLFNYIYSADLSATSLSKLVLGLMISTIIVAAGLLIHLHYNNGDKVEFTSTFQGSIRYNSYIFFAVSGTLFGSSSLTIVAVVSCYMIVFTNLLSVIVFARYIPNHKDGKNVNFVVLSFKLIMTNPLIISSILGFCFNYSGVI